MILLLRKFIEWDYTDNLFSPARGYKLSFESSKNEKLSLFLHGERNFDHVLLLPPKSKGSPFYLLLDTLSDRLQASDHH